MASARDVVLPARWPSMCVRFRPVPGGAENDLTLGLGLSLCWHFKVQRVSSRALSSTRYLVKTQHSTFKYICEDGTPSGPRGNPHYESSAAFGGKGNSGVGQGWRKSEDRQRMKDLGETAPCRANTRKPTLSTLVEGVGGFFSPQTCSSFQASSHAL